MDAQQKLNDSSPVVQRVYRLRERIIRNNAVVRLAFHHPHKLLDLADTDQTRKSYQWQMWQKSDFPSYDGDEPGHQCK